MLPNNTITPDRLRAAIEHADRYFQKIVLQHCQNAEEDHRRVAVGEDPHYMAHYPFPGGVGIAGYGHICDLCGGTGYYEPPEISIALSMLPMAEAIARIAEEAMSEPTYGNVFAVRDRDICEELLEYTRPFVEAVERLKGGAE